MHPENKLFETLAVPSKRQRYIELLDTKRGREKIRLSLDHFKDLDPRFCRRIKPSEQNLPEILRILKGLGAPPVCYVMSSDSELNGREMDLSEASAIENSKTALSPRGHSTGHRLLEIRARREVTWVAARPTRPPACACTRPTHRGRRKNSPR